MKKNVECHKADDMCTVRRRTTGREKPVEAERLGDVPGLNDDNVTLLLFFGCANER